MSKTTKVDGATFSKVVRARHSVRQSLADPVPHELQLRVLEDARWSPSNCNTQPWSVHVLSGVTLKAFSARVIEAADSDRETLDFTWSKAAFPAACVERYDEHGHVRHDAVGLAREDAKGRRRNDRRNLTFFNAPHVALLFQPEIGDNVRAAGDLGMYAQTFLLSLTAHGLGGIPQTSLGLYADTARDLLGLGSDMKLLFGIAFGYEDDASIYNSYRMGRVEISESVVFYD